jgi:hypothetical protein
MKVKWLNEMYLSYEYTCIVERVIIVIGAMFLIVCYGIKTEEGWLDWPHLAQKLLKYVSEGKI